MMNPNPDSGTAHSDLSEMIPNGEFPGLQRPQPDFGSRISEDDHYLKQELYALVGSSTVIFDFLKNGCLDGIWYWDLTDMSQEWLSPRFKALFGYEDDEMENSPAWWQANIHPDDLTKALENFERHKADPDHPYDQVVRYRHRDGSTVWVRCRGLMLRDADGTPIRMIGAHTDVTAMKEIERDLEITNEYLSQFASVASHDLQTPLRQIGLFAGMLREDHADNLDDEALDYLYRIEEGVERMRGMIQKFLTFARAEMPRGQLGPVQLSDVIDSARDVLSEQIADTNTTVVSATADHKVRGDLTLLQQVFINLIENAIKYRSEADPRIEINCTKNGVLCEVSVTDNGIGIDPHNRERVFELFGRMPQPDKTSGFGIGLSLCRQIILQHGGEIWLDAEHSGPGSRFLLALPAV